MALQKILGGGNSTTTKTATLASSQSVTFSTTAWGDYAKVLESSAFSGYNITRMEISLVCNTALTSGNIAIGAGTNWWLKNLTRADSDTNFNTTVNSGETAENSNSDNILESITSNGLYIGGDYTGTATITVTVTYTE